MQQRPRVLVIEDDGLVAIIVSNLLTEIGCDVVGPVVDRGMAVAAASSGAIQAAIIDHVRDGEHDHAIEDILVHHRIPFGLVLGKTSVIAERHRDRPSIVKPFSLPDLYAFLAIVLGTATAST